MIDKSNFSGTLKHFLLVVNAVDCLRQKSTLQGHKLKHHSAQRALFMTLSMKMIMAFAGHHLNTESSATLVIFTLAAQVCLLKIHTVHQRSSTKLFDKLIRCPNVQSCLPRLFLHKRLTTATMGSKQFHRKSLQTEHFTEVHYTRSSHEALHNKTVFT